MAAIEHEKDFELITDNVASVLASGRFPIDDAEKWHQFYEDTHGADRFLGLIAFPTIDIELEMYTGMGNEPYWATESEKDSEISLSYVVCIKGISNGKAMWVIDDFAGECNVDFGSDNWELLLEKEMIERVTEYAEKRGYSLTEYNF